MTKPEDTAKLNKSNRILLCLELVLAVAVSVTCAVAGMSNLLWSSNQLYPSASDAISHMSKVVYLAKQLALGHISGWFPYWYNGTALTQYDMSLSYYLMVPIYWLTDNVMLTYKIFCIGSMTVGGLGIWTLCYRKIGRFCGLIGILAFSFQPILLQTLYRDGSVAQGAAFAILPWLLLLILIFAETPNRLRFAGMVILSALLILSHAMLAVMVFVTTLTVLFLFIIIKRIRIINFILTGIGIAFATILTAFWSVVGATKLENPIDILPGAAYRYTATYHWFLPGDKEAILYFSAAISGAVVLAIIVYTFSGIFRSNKKDQKFYGLACILLTLVTFVFSFGGNLPGSDLVPIIYKLSTGRILVYTAITSSITCAYLCYRLWTCSRLKIITILSSIFIMAGIVYMNNPYDASYYGINYSASMVKYSSLNSNSSAFDKGRLSWYGVEDGVETYFAVLNNYNISNGWNQEGTLYNQMLDNNNIAFPLKYYNYIEKQAAYWNIRYLLINDNYSEFGTKLQNDLGFQKEENNQKGSLLYRSNTPSSYYLIDQRNSLVISNGNQGFTIAFPNMVQGRSADLLDYSDKELLKYKLIYIIEPHINTRIKKAEFENRVIHLINSGIKVMIEPAASNTFDLFGIHTADETIAKEPIFTMTTNSPYQLISAEINNNSGLSSVRGLYGLDKVYANFNYYNSNVTEAVLGAKKVGKGEVIFVGAHLSQYLEPVFTRNLGLAAVNNTISQNSKIIEKVYSSIFSFYGVNLNYLPETYTAVKKQSWDYNGGTFTYQSDETKEVTISVTYTPRWTATLDGKKIEVGQSENLITLSLPSGEHTVKLHYGITVYGEIGYLISAVSLLCFLLILLLWKWVMRFINYVSGKFGIYLQFYDEEPDFAGNAPINPVTEEVAVTQEALSSDEEVEQIVTENDDLKENQSQQTSENVDYYQIIRKTVDDNGILVDIIETDEEMDEDVLTHNNPQQYENKQDYTNKEYPKQNEMIQNNRKQEDINLNNLKQEDINQNYRKQENRKQENDNKLINESEADFYDQVLNQAIRENEEQKTLIKLSEKKFQNKEILNKEIQKKDSKKKDIQQKNNLNKTARREKEGKNKKLEHRLKIMAEMKPVGNRQLLEMLIQESKNKKPSSSTEKRRNKTNRNMKNHLYYKKSGKQGYFEEKN